MIAAALGEPCLLPQVRRLGFTECAEAKLLGLCLLPPEGPVLLLPPSQLRGAGLDGQALAGGLSLRSKAGARGCFLWHLLSCLEQQTQFLSLPSPKDQLPQCAHLLLSLIIPSPSPMVSRGSRIEGACSQANFPHSSAKTSQAFSCSPSLQPQQL